MPIYLVRWPGLVAALVSAANEDSLMDILDETANPEGCTWSVYGGPICIEFNLNAAFQIDETDGRSDRPLGAEQVKIGDVSRICERNTMTAVIPEDSDTAHMMTDAILATAFPVLHDALSIKGDSVPSKKVQAALREELDALVKASWLHQQTKRRADPESRTAAEMGTLPRLIAHWSKLGALADQEERDAPPPKKPTPKRKPKPKKPK